MNKKSSENRELRVVVELVLKDSQPMVSSIVVAELFGKQHKKVLRDINELEIPDDYRELNFEPTFRDVPGPNGAIRKEPAFNMTRDGFSLLAMGFTGNKAMEWKIKFLDAFNSMESRLKIPQVEAKLKIFKAKPEALKSLEGFVRYWCYLENISWEDGKRLVEAAVRVPDFYEMDVLALESAWSYVILCTTVVPTRFVGVDVCSEKDLSPVNGLLDYWAHCGKSSRIELLGNLCQQMNIDSLVQLPKSYITHAVNLLWKGINSESGKYNAVQKESY
ncbi:Rha family transcriptional regulator [Desulfovibrio gilichinskyi]|uniref:Phage regulatory protein, rha family n=1 Tax=Desulfovibrio gilichinskyi TaxID=1519643 RepID=A0A1X7F1I2_9BACT|nr:Rha family transcriptional regulator [Desulfovibrio gilichinskyi]SMF44272.1 phage regulatory protein, rha family [Desulfovibrio gilichinskyi]